MLPHRTFMTSKKRFLFLLLINCLIPFLGSSQVMQLKNDITVTANGSVQINAWAGGFNNAQFSSIDLDNDGLKDLLVFDRSDNSVIPFLNKGSNGSIDYQFAPNYIDVFPDTLGGWVLARDYDRDGYVDLFAGSPTSNILVFRNVSAANNDSLTFELVKAPLTSKYPSPLYLYTPLNDISSISDLDGDGDLDILTFDVLGYQVEWHKCVSVDSGWGFDSLQFVLQSYCYGHFFEDPNNCTATVDQTPCQAGMDPNYNPYSLLPSARGRHAGSTLTSLDLNADGVMEMLVGDVGCPDIYALYNGGTTSIANFDSVEALYPTLDVTINVPMFAATFYEDIDNDGVRDLITSPNLVGEAADRRSVWLHRNQGADDNPNFKFEKEDFIQDEMIERGTISSVALFDYNGDSLIDMVVGNLGEYDHLNTLPGTPKIASLALYVNEGSQNRPSFRLIDDNWLGIAGNPNFQGMQYFMPTFGDLDGDNDQDLLIGEVGGMLMYWEDTSSAGNNAAFKFITPKYFNIDVGSYSAPLLWDIDGDLDQDLIIGNAQGYLHYYENSGDPFTAQMDSMSGTFGAVKINDFTQQVNSNGFSRPGIADWDDDGNMELLVGSVEGKVHIYDDVDHMPNTTFTLAGYLADHDFGMYSGATASKWDSTGKYTYIVGSRRGGLQLYGPPLPPDPLSNEPGIVAEGPSFEVYPNPAENIVNIRVQDLQNPKGYELRLLNSLGQIVKTLRMGSTQSSIDLNGLSNGVYFVQLNWNGGSLSKKLIVQQ